MCPQYFSFDAIGDNTIGQLKENLQKVNPALYRSARTSFQVPTKQLFVKSTSQRNQWLPADATLASNNAVVHRWGVTSTATRRYFWKMSRNAWAMARHSMSWQAHLTSAFKYIYWIFLLFAWTMPEANGTIFCWTGWLCISKTPTILRISCTYLNFFQNMHKLVVYTCLRSHTCGVAACARCMHTNSSIYSRNAWIYPPSLCDSLFNPDAAIPGQTSRARSTAKLRSLSAADPELNACNVSQVQVWAEWVT